MTARLAEMRGGLLAALVIITPHCAAAAVDYLREIKPLLTEQCYRCHGASQQKGELRLDTAALARKGGENGASIQPSKGNDSLLIQAVKGTHDSISRMPYKKPPLTEEQISLLAKWIDEGAKAPPMNSRKRRSPGRSFRPRAQKFQRSSIVHRPSPVQSTLSSSRGWRRKRFHPRLKPIARRSSAA
ncbi:MAG TPA: c-type cytochrome domain-containing protein [Candidatus Limnocylindria bacterium]|nr:c-type cytochrome domain-containing protein [Candidatus Limnocylindria bacterium]